MSPIERARAGCVSCLGDAAGEKGQPPAKRPEKPAPPRIEAQRRRQSIRPRDWRRCLHGPSRPRMGHPVTAAARHPLIPPRNVDPQQRLPELELEVLERWRERDVFAESLRRREGAPRWSFYEGPPTANGAPGSHHVLARVFKDIYP